MKVRIAGVSKESVVDGPGVRYVIFAQGCLHNCMGCHNPETHDFNGGYEIDADYLINEIENTKHIDGVTLSGGDPFYQSEAFLYITERLKKKLAMRLKDSPKAHHYIICHSHAGNIALCAVAGNDLENKIDGIVCLATPFLLARERDFGINPAVILGSAIVVAVLLLTLGISAVWPGLWDNSIGLWLFQAAMFVFAFLLASLWLRFAYKLRKELTPAQVSDPSRFLIIRSPADEASGALVLSQFLSWITVRIYLYFENLLQRFKAALTGFAERKWIVATVVAAALVAFAAS
jgi:hypothetical protein